MHIIITVQVVYVPVLFVHVLFGNTTYLVLQCVPLTSRVSEIEGRESETNLSEKLVSTKPVPVPHTQP